MRSVLVAALLMSSLARAADLEALGRATVDELARRELASVTRRFDATMKGALPSEKLAAAWDGLIAQNGAFQGTRGTRLQDAGKYKIVFVTVAFAKARLDVKLAFDDKEQIAGLFFVPIVDWQPPPYFGAFSERELTVGGLPATLTLPRAPGRHPAVVLIHGSGPNDRDETIGAHKPFKDLAGGLASRGVAVLRFDKRTLKYPRQFAGVFTVKEEVLDDAHGAVSVLRAQPEIDPKRVFVAGHSLGGMLAPRIALGDSRVAGVVILAGSTRPLDEAIVEQMKYLAPDDAARIEAAQASARAIRNPELKREDRIDVLGARMPGAYFLDLRAYKPVQAASQLRIPIFVLQGGRDYQVTRADFDGWQKGIGARARTKLYPALDHTFAEGSGPSRPEDYARAGHVAEEVVRDLADWITKPK